MTVPPVRSLIAFIASFSLLMPGAGTAASPMRSHAKMLYAHSMPSPQGLSAAQLRAAYHATGTGSAKVAVITAYGDPNIKADLDNYSRVMGLPALPTCASRAQTGCFEKIDQRGGQRFPAADNGWAMETALDVETVHAICPGCRIELVQADTASSSNLLAAIDMAAGTGAQVISMSWGGPESSSQTTYDRHFQAADVTFVASSGDSGYGASWPAASNQVVAVGGTHLQIGSNGRASETAWSGSGSGCSHYEAKPAWQHDTGCVRRTIADVSADADPATGAAVVSSLSPSGAGWNVVGGTSLAAPLVAGLIGLSGHTSHTAALKQLYGSLGTSRLYDVASGRNGSCAPAYLCAAGSGYDGPTGVGAPNALSAF
jgi:subtilase family serine protease